MDNTNSANMGNEESESSDLFLWKQVSVISDAYDKLSAISRNIQEEKERLELENAMLKGKIEVLKRELTLARKYKSEFERLPEIPN